jgi:hypothetical protein
VLDELRYALADLLAVVVVAKVCAQFCLIGERKSQNTVVSVFTCEDGEMRS